MGTIFLVAYILVGIAQIWAGLEGMQLYFGIGGFLAIIFLSVAYAVPLVGTVGVALLAYYGARYGWKWEWWLALTLAVPGVILMLAASLTVGLAIWVQRLGWLISLHHDDGAAATGRLHSIAKNMCDANTVTAITGGRRTPQSMTIHTTHLCCSIGRKSAVSFAARLRSSISTVAVMPAASTTPVGTSSICTRTGMRCARRTHVKIGLTFATP